LPELPEARPQGGLASSHQRSAETDEVFGPCLIRLDAAPDQDLKKWADQIAHDAIGWDGVFACSRAS